MLLTVLLVAAIVDGRVSKSESALLEEAHHLCHSHYDRDRVVPILKAFLHGQGVEEEWQTDSDLPPVKGK